MSRISGTSATAPVSSASASTLKSSPRTPSAMPPPIPMITSTGSASSSTTASCGRPLSPAETSRRRRHDGDLLGAPGFERGEQREARVRDAGDVRRAGTGRAGPPRSGGEHLAERRHLPLVLVHGPQRRRSAHVRGLEVLAAGRAALGRDLEALLRQLGATPSPRYSRRRGRAVGEAEHRHHRVVDLRDRARARRAKTLVGRRADEERAQIDEVADLADDAAAARPRDRGSSCRAAADRPRRCSGSRAGRRASRRPLRSRARARRSGGCSRRRGSRRSRARPAPPRRPAPRRAPTGFSSQTALPARSAAARERGVAVVARGDRRRDRRASARDAASASVPQLREAELLGAAPRRGAGRRHELHARAPRDAAGERRQQHRLRVVAGADERDADARRRLARARGERDALLARARGRLAVAEDHRERSAAVPAARSS